MRESVEKNIGVVIEYKIKQNKSIKGNIEGFLTI